MREWIKKHREMVFYLFFGVLTTAVNYVTALAANGILAKSGITVSWPAVSIAWLVSVLFAYVTNRVWVFHSEKTAKGEVLQEMAAFFGGRFFSGILEVGLMTLFVDIIGWNFDVMKLLCIVLVIVINYVFSKLFVFRSKEKQRADGSKQV